MKQFGIRLLVKDFAASVTFWRDTMGYKPEYVGEEYSYAYFPLEASFIEILQHEAFFASLGIDAPAIPEHKTTLVEIEVDDVDATYNRLIAEGVPSIAGLVTREQWMARTAHVKDPDGNIIEIYTRLQPAKAATE